MAANVRRAVAAFTVALLLAACAATAPSPSPGGARIEVVTTTGVLADFVRQVGGDRVDVHALVPHGGDVHTFDPAPSHAQRLTGARLLVMNGLGLDDWLLALAREAGAANVPVIELGEEATGIDYIEGEPDEHGHAANPHVWLDVAYARLYVPLIGAGLTDVDPAGSATYEANSAAFDAQLAELDGWIREQLSALPPTARRVVSFHDAFPYFARAYGLELIGVVVPVPGQEPSAGEIAQLVTAIRETGVRAILAEAQFSDELARTIAEETGARVVSDLYTDSLGDPPADTFVGAMRWNVEQIRSALE
ncbi:MAG: metal ABC transporter substrate-binding protein [Chloroflexota bacterium]|nr:metal ABC transporter substrate-binding protein [Chloroflexota bacterium]